MSAETYAWSAIGSVWALQGLLLTWAIVISKKSAPRLGEELEKRCARDVEIRSKQGLLPDWQRYLSDADRLFEPRGDRLRVLASSVLALGLFGTLVTMLLTLLAFRAVGAPSLEMSYLILGTLRALSGSCLGVLFHLHIALVLLRGAEKRFLIWQGQFEMRLQEHADRFPPAAPFLPLLKEELAEIRRSLSGEFASALAKAVTGFPESVHKLELNLEKLSVVIETQDRSLGQAIQLLAADSNAVALTGETLAPIATRLAEALSHLEAVPASLQEVLETARADWLAGLRTAQEDRLREISAAAQSVQEAAQARERQMLAAVRVLEAAVGEVRDAVSRISGDLEIKIGELADRLGTEFGREARDSTRGLAESLKGLHERTLERMAEHDQQMRNSIGTEVGELFQRVRQSFDDDLFSRLAEIGAGLQGAATVLSPLAEQLQTAAAEIGRRQGEALDGWTAAGRQIADAAESLVGADRQVKLSAQALGECASQLRQVTADLESGARETGAVGAQRDRLLARQAEVLRECIHLLAGEAA